MTKSQRKVKKKKVLQRQLAAGERFPTAQEGLSLLQSPPTTPREAALWRGPYLEDKLPQDPWGNAYLYAVPGADGQPFALYSLGSDGRPGGSGDAADLGLLPAAGNSP